MRTGQRRIGEMKEDYVLSLFSQTCRHTNKRTHTDEDHWRSIVRNETILRVYSMPRGRAILLSLERSK